MQKQFNPGEDLGSCCAIQTQHPTALQSHLSTGLIGQCVLCFTHSDGEEFHKEAGILYNSDGIALLIVWEAAGQNDGVR